jgi:putative glutathione S-transferase
MDMSDGGHAAYGRKSFQRSKAHFTKWITADGRDS